MALFGARARLLKFIVVELLLAGAGGALYPHKPCRFSAKCCRFSALLCRFDAKLSVSLVAGLVNEGFKGGIIGKTDLSFQNNLCLF